MKKCRTRNYAMSQNHGMLKLLRIMKLTTILLLIATLQIFANGVYSQDKDLTLNLSNTNVGHVLTEIENQSEFYFLFNQKLVDTKREVTVRLTDKKIEEVLDRLFSETTTEYVVMDRQIVLSPKEYLSEIKSTIQAVSAQQAVTVSGTVVDSEGQTLPGVSVSVKGTSVGTITNAEGKYSLSDVSEDAVLVFSFIGLLTQEIAVGNQTIINVTMESDVYGLEEIVVIGYGTISKSDLTGAVSSLKSDDLNPGANVSVDQMMLGRAAGVQITQSSSEPGGGLSIRIRGASSINASNEPLYVIDGFPIDNSPNMSSGGAASLAANLSPRNPLNSLNPNDIESIEILKDASATAIYGSRGANGVIMVTTKKGRNETMRVSYNVYGGVQKVAKTMDILSTDQYIGLMNDLSADQGNPPVFTGSDISGIGAGTDWQEQIYNKSAAIMDHNLSVSGGNKSTSVFASLNYFDQDGVVKNSGIKKYIGRINVESQIGKRIDLSLNLNTSLVDDRNGVDGVNTNEQGGPIYASLLYDPTEPIYNADGSFNQSSNLTVNNPVSLIEGVSSKNKTNRTFGNLLVSYEVIDGLTARLNLGTDFQNSRRDIYNSRVTFRGGPEGGIANISTLERSNYLVEYTMDYHKSINENNELTLLGGVTYQSFTNKLFAANISGFPTDDIGTGNLGLGDTNTDDLSSYHQENTLLSYLGRINYNLYNKFLLTGSLRADGSSRFGENNKYGYFPSFAFGWKLSEESFIPELFEELKLRASWGQTGNQEIGNYASQLTFGSGPDVVFNNMVLGGTIPSRIANPDLKWETTEQFNVGIDASVLSGRISATLDFFSKNTKDLLFNMPLPLSSGYNSILMNVGEVENKGIEFLINSTNISSENFHWNMSINFSALKNKVLDLGRVEQIVTGSIQAVGNTAIIKTGAPLASYYGYEVIGIFQEGDDIANSPQPSAQPGFPIFADINNDGAITPDDQKIIGDPFPDFTYGFQNSFTYKGWQLDIFFHGQEGADLLNINVIESLYPANFRRNRLADQSLDRWTPQNTDAKWPSGVDPNAYGASKVHSLVLQDASFFRLKNVQLSYKVPVKRLNSISSLKVYFTAQNVFTITNYVGFDPEANSFGSSNVRVDYSSYPMARTFLLGLNARF